MLRNAGGEFVEHDLAVAASDPELVNATVEEIVRLGANRKSWLVFASGVNHAGMLKEQFEVHGIEVDLVTGEDGKNKRNSTLAKFKSGQTRCLINVNVLTTGFDAPSVDLVALVRATRQHGPIRPDGGPWDKIVRRQGELPCLGLRPECRAARVY
jgi:DNA repair protein RadD